jgi:hypothetical protein
MLLLLIFFVNLVGLIDLLLLFFFFDLKGLVLVGGVDLVDIFRVFYLLLLDFFAHIYFSYI